jgi:hypothetical protein
VRYACFGYQQVKALIAERHCPSGVAEPTYAPSAAAAITSAASGSITSVPAASASASDNHDHDDNHSHAVTASTCEPHGDHWHCPSGVAEPTTAPAQTFRVCKHFSCAGDRRRIYRWCQSARHHGCHSWCHWFVLLVDSQHVRRSVTSKSVLHCKEQVQRNIEGV